MVTRVFHRHLECGEPIPLLPCTWQWDAQVDLLRLGEVFSPNRAKFCYFLSRGSNTSYQGNRLKSILSG